MLIREQSEERELQHLSPYASKSRDTKGREHPEEKCDIRTEYQRDRDRILHSKSFRRLKHKTQVFLAPQGDHYRTRLTHTLEVSQIARTIARALELNEDLTEAIALGHDLGHTPFGHAGEKSLNSVCALGFAHYLQSIRVVELLEKDGRGLNLTWEVRDGIKNHRTSGHPATLEGQIVRYSDKIAYINHDIDDAIRGRIMTEEQIPAPIRQVLGDSTRKRLNTLIHSIVDHSIAQEQITMDQDIEYAMQELRRYMFDHVYTHSAAKSEEYKVEGMLTALFGHYLDNIGQMPDEYIRLIVEQGEPPERVVCDYIAGMTDQYSIDKFTELFVPGEWNIK